MYYFVGKKFFSYTFLGYLVGLVIQLSKDDRKKKTNLITYV